MQAHTHTFTDTHTHTKYTRMHSLTHAYVHTHIGLAGKKTNSPVRADKEATHGERLDERGVER